MKKILVPVLIIAIVGVLVIATSKNIIAKVGMEKGVHALTGLRLNVDKVDVGIATTLVGIENLRLLNPPQFEDKIMLDMPEIFVNYNLLAIIRGKIHLRELRLNMNEFIVVKNSQGELNLDSLNVVREQEGKKPADPEAKAKVPDIQIDDLALRIGRVIYKDYSGRGEPQIREFNVDINERFYDINDPDKLVSLIVVRALSKTAIARLTNFDLGSLQGTIQDTLASAQEIVGDAGGMVERTQKAAEELKGTLESTAKEAKSAVEEFAGALKSPFGSSEE